MKLKANLRINFSRKDLIYFLVVVAAFSLIQRGDISAAISFLLKLISK
jgi:hypothetical protein